MALRQVRNAGAGGFIAGNIAYISKGFSSLNLSFAYFYKISSNIPARIRAYNSDNMRSVDWGRPSYIDPRKRSFIAHGIIFDVVLGVNQSPLELAFAPIAFHAGDEVYLNYEPLSEPLSEPIAIIYYLG